MAEGIYGKGVTMAVMLKAKFPKGLPEIPGNLLPGLSVVIGKDVIAVLIERRDLPPTV